MSTSEELAAELYDLWVAGSVSLPNLAVIYAQATRDLHNTSWREDDAFERSDLDVDVSFPLPSFETESLGPVYPQWSALRDVLQVILGKTADNLTDTGVALVSIADEYATTDATAATILTGLRGDRLATPGLDQPPESIPVTKRPDDPHDVLDFDVSVDLPWVPDIDLDLEVPQR